MGQLTSLFAVLSAILLVHAANGAPDDRWWPLVRESSFSHLDSPYPIALPPADIAKFVVPQRFYKNKPTLRKDKGANVKRNKLSDEFLLENDQEAESSISVAELARRLAPLLRSPVTESSISVSELSRRLAPLLRSPLSEGMELLSEESPLMNFTVAASELHKLIDRLFSGAPKMINLMEIIHSPAFAKIWKFFEDIFTCVKERSRKNQEEEPKERNLKSFLRNFLLNF